MKDMLQPKLSNLNSYLHERRCKDVPREPILHRTTSHRPRRPRRRRRCCGATCSAAWLDLSHIVFIIVIVVVSVIIVVIFVVVVFAIAVTIITNRLRPPPPVNCPSTAPPRKHTRAPVRSTRCLRASPRSSDTATRRGWVAVTWWGSRHSMPNLSVSDPTR